MSKILKFKKRLEEKKILTNAMLETEDLNKNLIFIQ